MLAVVATIAIAVASACAPDSSAARLTHSDPAFELLNEFRTVQRRAPLARSAELDYKAQAHAQLMADRGDIFHSANLPAGVSPGWRLIGENVAVAATIERAQRLLEDSPPHRRNMLDPAFTEAGMGVVERGTAVFVVQIFVQR